MAKSAIVSDYAMLRFADAARAKGDLDEALMLWSAYRHLYPAEAPGYLKASAALRETGHLDAAEAICGNGLASGADPLGMSMEYARIAQRRDDWEAALERWQNVVAAFPSILVAAVSACLALIRLNRLDEAETMVADARARFPGDARVERLFAQIAQARGDWQQAVDRWDAVLAQHPDDGIALKARMASARHLSGKPRRARLREIDASPDDYAPSLVDVGRVENPEAQALLMRFESLGGNCEFGLVQRRFGAEPLGLLRWTSLSSRALVRLLETRFVGVGDPDSVELKRNAAGDYTIKDRVSALAFHTFLSSDIAQPEDFLAKQSARLRWLREKLLEDLDEGEKIFVYKPVAEIPATLLERLLQAMRRYGGAKLLCIRAAPSGVVSGTVVDAGRGLLHGYISVLNPVRPGVWSIPFEEWLAVCNQAVIF